MQRYGHKKTAGIRYNIPAVIIFIRSVHYVTKLLNA